MKTPQFFQRSELSRTLWLFRREFLVAAIFTAVVNVLMLTPTLYMLQVFDRVMLSQSVVTLVVLTLIMLFFFGVMAFSEWVRSRLLVRTGVKLDCMLSSRIFAATFESHLGQTRGSNPAQAFNDLATLRQFMTGNGFFAFMDAPWSPLYIGVLFLLHPFLGWVSILFAVFIIAMAYVLGRGVQKPLEESSRKALQANEFVRGKLRSADVIESMGMMERLRLQWWRQVEDYFRHDRNASGVAGRAQYLTKFFRYVQQSLTLAAGAILVIRGDLTPAAMIAANFLMGRATQPLDALVSNWRSALSARDAFLRLEALLEGFPSGERSSHTAKPIGHLRVQELQALAEGREEPILKGVTVDFPLGAVIGIIGPSGSGKSTFARCLLGIWPQVKGRVELDGELLDNWDREDLGRHVGYLPQDVELFEGSIAENIARFGKLDSQLVIEACKRAGVHDMILRLPKGYDTPMGRGGGYLSGGQRQRIGLARALYGDPQVVVLDEPNANLDEAGELALMRAVDDMRARGRSVFLITHRKNVVGLTDFLMVLRNGTLLCFGPRQEVMDTLQAASSAAPASPPDASALPAAG